MWFGQSVGAYSIRRSSRQEIHYKSRKCRVYNHSSVSHPSIISKEKFTSIISLSLIENSLRRLTERKFDTLLIYTVISKIKLSYLIYDIPIQNGKPF